MPPLLRTLLQAVIGIGVILVLWAIAAPLAVTRGFATFMAPSPVQVISKAIELSGNDVFRQHLWTSLVAFGQGVVPALFGGIAVGIAMRTSDGLRWVLGSLVVTVAAAPVIALAPLFILWFGLSSEAKIGLIVLMTAFPVAATVSVAKSRVPPAIVAALRIGVTLGVIALIASEFVGARSGLGHFIANASSQLDPTAMLAAFCVAALPLILLIALLQGIEEQMAG
jgi:NitT/TauT family transport system permease protein